MGSPARFAQEVWSRGYQHYANADADSYADVLTLSRVDSLITTGGLRAPNLRMVRSGQSVPKASYTRSQSTGGQRVGDAVDPQGAVRGFASGATVILQALHRFVPSVQAFCYELEDYFGHPLQANAYLTPEGARGLGVHHDTHDVLVLQLFGAKTWRLYPQNVTNAVDGYPASKRHPELGRPDVSLTLSPGDCLYLPRGLPHDAETAEGASLHLTLGIRSPTWLNVLGRVLKEAHEIPDLRASLPLGYASNGAAELAPKLRAVLDKAAAWLGQQDEQELAEMEVARRRKRTRSPQGALARFAALGPVQTTTVFKRKRAKDWALHSDANHTILLVDSTALKFPARIDAALQHLVSLSQVSAKALAPFLDFAGGLVLLKRLHREGLLERLHD